MDPRQERLGATLASAVSGAEVECADGKAAGFECKDVTLLSFIPVQSIGGTRGVELSGNWGWTDPETGKEYALVGRMDGTAFVDVTDPENPVYVGQLCKTEGSPGSFWREIKVYKNHAFIVSDGAGAHGMQIFDLTRLRNVSNTPQTFTEDALRSHPERPQHRDQRRNRFRVRDRQQWRRGDLRRRPPHDRHPRPREPAVRGCFSDPSTGIQKTGYTHDAQCVVYNGPDAEHRGREICFNSNETALSIADVTDKQNPMALAVAEYPNVGYTHQGG